MGHETVLVIGDDFRAQLDRFQRTEYANPASKHIVEVDVLNDAKRCYEASSKSDKNDFLGWMKSWYGISVLAEGQGADVLGKQRHGWVRLDSAGRVCEAIERKIPSGFFDWFECTDNSWKLKPGAGGLVIDHDGAEAAALDGFAGSARKFAIDLDGMREAVFKFSLDHWDHARAACGSQTWEPFKAILLRYETAAKTYDPEMHLTAVKEWKGQSAVKAISDAFRLDDSHWKAMSRLERQMMPSPWSDQTDRSIDRLRLSRNDYAAQYTLRNLLWYGVVIRDGVMLKDVEERQLFDSIADDTVLTLANVHS